MQEGIIQWHPAFTAALQIELMDNEEQLTYSSEHPLSRKPLQADIIIRKESSDIPIRKSIGHIFRRYNIFEYKSPNDYLSINDFYKTYAYACLFQSDTRNTMEINPEEITISFACCHYPRELFQHLAQMRGITIQEYDEGIYYLLASPYLFPMQVILTHHLSKQNYYWMQHLRNNLKSGGEIQGLIEAYENEKNDILYQAVMDVIVRANREEMEVEKKMCEALKELFADEFQKCKEEAKSQGIQQGEINNIHYNIMDFLNDFGAISADIQQKIYATDDMDLLRQWLRFAAKADSLEDFAAKIS